MRAKNVTKTLNFTNHLGWKPFKTIISITKQYIRLVIRTRIKSIWSEKIKNEKNITITMKSGNSKKFFLFL